MGGTVGQTTSFTVWATDKTAGVPAKGASIRMKIANTALTKTLTTDASGRAVWNLAVGEQLPKGSYTLITQLVGSTQYRSSNINSDYYLYPGSFSVTFTGATGKQGSRVKMYVKYTRQDGSKPTRSITVGISSYGVYRKDVTLKPGVLNELEVVVWNKGDGVVNLAFPGDDYYLPFNVGARLTGN